MPAFDDQSPTATLPDGVVITAPGLTGTADSVDLDLRTATASPLTPALPARLVAGLQKAEMTRTHRIRVKAQQSAQHAGLQRESRADVVVQVPHPGVGARAVMLIHDADGIVTFHFPDLVKNPVEQLAAAAPGGAIPLAPLRFTLARARLTRLTDPDPERAGAPAVRQAPSPALRGGAEVVAPEAVAPEAVAPGAPAAVAPAGAPAAGAGPLPGGALTAAAEAVSSALSGGPVAVAEKVISIFKFPIDHAIGWLAEKAATAWEAKSHPYGFVRYAAGAWQEVTPDAAFWTEISQGRALLLVHGIFSNIEGGFFSLLKNEAGVNVLDQLAGKYTAVFGFNHPTASVTPDDNARKFLTSIAGGINLDIDILCHSRGGLVSRVLSGEHAGVPVGNVKVGKIVFAGTPNDGTAVVDTANFGALIDRIINVLNFFPLGPAETITDGILELVKIVGTGAADGLVGLESMKVGSPLLTALNPNGLPVTAGHCAIDADFRPTGPLLDLLRPGDDVLDWVFGEVANDVAVPSAGVGTVPDDSHGDFPVEGDNLLAFPAGDVWHCSYFQKTETAAKLLEWLTG